jgi:hypothetical protein
MTEVLTVLVAVVLLVVAGLAFATALGMPLGRASAVGALVAEALLVLAAVLDLGRMLGGRTPSEPVVHVGYVLASVLLLPILVRPLGAGRSGEDAPGNGPAGEDPSDEDARGRQLVLSLACLAVLVVVWRQSVTG